MEKRRLSALEIVGVMLITAVVGAVLWSQQGIASARERDITRKTAINHVYYYLETIYYPAHHFYPDMLVATQLPGLDAKYLKDPDGKSAGDVGSNIHYDPLRCDQGACSGYTLRSGLELEADFTKTSNR